jgi:hypothetical protein
MLFRIIALISVMSILFRQSFLRFNTIFTAEGKIPALFSMKAYGSWLLRHAGTSLSSKTFTRAKSILHDWTANYYPGWTRWIFIGVGASVVSLAASGFFFAIFIPRGIFGLPLLAHVILGGLFAISLAALLFWRGRVYLFDGEEEAVFESFARPVFKNLSKTFFRKILFWAFATFGFVQVLTALGSMLPVFTLEAQRVMMEIHRYSALCLLLTTIVLIDIAFIPQRRP